MCPHASDLCYCSGPVPPGKHRRRCRFRGRDGWPHAGLVLHSSQRRDDGAELRSKRVLVVGGGKSAQEAAAAALRAGATSVTLALRQPHLLVPFRLFGLVPCAPAMRTRGHTLPATATLPLHACSLSALHVLPVIAPAMFVWVDWLKAFVRNGRPP